MAYKRQNAPREYDPYWLDQELERLEQMLLGPDTLRLKEQNVAPAKPRLGDIYLADGTNWDPGAGPGVYRFDGSSFVLLGFDQIIDTDDIADNAITQPKMANNSVGTAEIIDANVTLAKLANLTNQRVIGRNTAGSGVPEEVTLSQLLDWIGSPAQGDILYRAAAAWARLGAGTSGQFLQTQGTGADPQWAAAKPVLIASGAISNAATVEIPLDGDTWDLVRIILLNIVPQTDNTSLFMRYDQGSGFLSGASDYQWALSRGSVLVADTADTEITIADAVGSSSNERLSVEIKLFRPGDADMIKVAHWLGGYRAQNAAAVDLQGWGELILNDNAITDLQLLMSSGNIASGYYYAIGEKYS